jgi:hypothetical protein
LAEGGAGPLAIEMESINLVAGEGEPTARAEALVE